MRFRFLIFTHVFIPKPVPTFGRHALVIRFDSDFSTVTFDEGTPFRHHAHALDHSRRRPDQAG
ncbi:hypothetical protein MPLA_1220043 [Mesorhizobium sp. ORS 3359]|nr:hypothetical protein MPLA_1220043 [Mesorhizobium sp. ORS 3359]